MPSNSSRIYIEKHDMTIIVSTQKKLDYDDTSEIMKLTLKCQLHWLTLQQSWLFYMNTNEKNYTLTKA